MMIKLLLIDLVNFFTSVEETTCQKIKQLTNECGYAPAQQTCSPEFPRAEWFFFYQTRQAVHSLDVEKIVASLSRKKALGLDKILIHVINIAAPVIIPSVTAIINSSFTTSTYPGDWKMAEASPLERGWFWRTRQQ